MTYDAGRANKRIKIMRATTSRNEIGEAVQTWDLYRRAWAVVTQEDGSEVWAGGADQFVNQTATRFEIRHGPTITTEDRIDYAGRKFRIVSVVDVAEMRRFTKIKAIETEEAIA